jgi:hypothetical protein
MRFLLVFFLAVFPGVALAAVCEETDGSFPTFFREFSDRPDLQRARVTDPVRFGYWPCPGCEGERKWVGLPRNRLLELYPSSIVPRTTEQSSGYRVVLGKPHQGHNVVNIVRNGSDTYVLTLFFRSSDGCWFLYGIQDDSANYWNF